MDKPEIQKIFSRWVARGELPNEERATTKATAEEAVRKERL